MILWSECSLPVAYVKRGGHNSLPTLILKPHTLWDDQELAASYVKWLELRTQMGQGRDIGAA